VLLYTVHSQNGTRLGCGVIEAVKYDDSTKNLLTSDTSNLTSSGVTSQVTVYTVNNGIACYFGSATKLEANLLSYLNPSMAGPNCNFTNGCGVHIHNGTSCFNRTTQGGHYYNTVEDPWLLTMYDSTDASGSAYYTGCVETGVLGNFNNRAFVVHSNNGTRVSCGILAGTPVIAPAPAPVRVPTPTTRKRCGLLGWSIFCPFTLCGWIGRWLGFCQMK
jgi:hypothetical protein